MLTAGFFEQIDDYGVYEAKKIEIMNLEDKDIILSIFERKYTTHNSGPSCPSGSIKIIFLKENGSIIEFYPATDSCTVVFYGEMNKYFEISKQEKFALQALWVRYGFSEIYV